MNANELADELDSFLKEQEQLPWGTKQVYLDQAATMLRQQQAEIETLKAHPAELTLSIGEIHAVWAAGKYYELDKDGQVDEIKFTEFAYAILIKAQEK
jgi:hypothetical protein